MTTPRRKMYGHVSVRKRTRGITSRPNKSTYPLRDPVLINVRKARVAWDKAENDYAELVVAALESGYSYRQVATAALTWKGALHRWVRLYLESKGRKLAREYVPPADVPDA